MSLEMKKYMKDKHPDFCQVMKQCELSDHMCKLIDNNRHDYIIIIPTVIVEQLISNRKNKWWLLASYIIVFKKGGRPINGSHSCATLLKDKRRTITFNEDGKTITVDGNTIAKVDETNDRVYKADLKGVEKQKSSGTMKEVEPSLIDIENDYDPNLAAVRVNDKNVKMECVYCGRGSRSIKQEISSALTFCDVPCQMDYYMFQTV
jgi:hypothetical protein